MSLEEIVTRAIPISQHDCSMKKAQKERMRRELKGRVEEWYKEEVKKELAKQSVNY